MKKTPVNTIAAAIIVGLVASACSTAGTSEVTPAATQGTVETTQASASEPVIAATEAPVSTGSQNVAATCTRLNLNTLTQDQLVRTIPNFPNRMVREFFEYRPYESIQEYRREIGKYVGDAQTAEWEQYIYVPVDPNQSDAETLKQIPGVDDAVASALITGRPFASTQEFLDVLAGQVSADQAAQASCYVES